MSESIKGLENSMGYVLMNGKKYPLDTPNVGIAQVDEDIRAAVEYSCGDCCKRLSNAFIAVVFIPLNLVVVFPPEGECLKLETFCGGKLVQKQILTSSIILLDRVCSFEVYNQKI